MKNGIYMFLVLLFTFILQSAAQELERIATYSIVGWDSLTGDLGVAIQSKFLAVGAVVPYAKAGVGAVATQALANTSYGPKGLSLLEKGLSAEEAISALLSSDPDISGRQLGIVDARGNAYAHTGSKCSGYAGHRTGRGYSAQGNMLANREVVEAMGEAFEKTNGDLAERLLSALESGERAGGDRRGRQSAALLIVREKGGYSGFNDRFIDLRVDDSQAPLMELRRLYGLWMTEFSFDARFRTIMEFESQKKYIAADAERKRVTQEFNALLKSKPDDPNTLNDIAWYLASYDIDKVQALELAQRAAKLAPSNLRILETLAECHFQLKHYDEAISIASELVAKEPSNDRCWNQLRKYREAKQTSINPPPDPNR